MRFLIVISFLLVAVAHAAVAGETKVLKGDTLLISIKGVPEGEQAQVNGSYQVTKGGDVFLPYLAQTPIKAAGVDLKIIAKNIELAYIKSGIYSQPLILVRQPTGYTHGGNGGHVNTEKFLIVSGEVHRPGSQVFRSGLRIIDVVSVARPVELAALDRVELLRAGKTYIFDMNIPAHMDEKVYPNDQISVKR